jgi:hypothetical protein
MSASPTDERRHPTDRCVHSTPEDGVALITVLGLSLAIAILVSASVAYALNTMPQVRDHEDWNAALAAAEAGVDDALFRLNQNSSYWAVEDVDNLALSDWREVPGGDSPARYHYRLDASQVTSTGAIDVVSTGLVGDQRRTIEVRLRRDNFLDFLYFTDFEVTDPYAWPTLDLNVRSAMDDFCGVHWPERDGREGPVQNTTDPAQMGCGQIRFVPGDELRGPVHSNDALRIEVGSGGPSGEPAGRPRFYGEVTTGWSGSNVGQPDNQLWLRNANSTPDDPYFQDGIASEGRLTIPPTNQRLAEQAADTGCVYEGPTLIRFHHGGGQSRMSVASPLTPANAAGTGCGPGTNLPLPSGEAIFVRNSTASTSGHPLGLPRSNDISSYPTRAGDAFVYGEVRGQLTVGAENDIYVAHDLTYADRSPNSSDLTGLIANNNIRIYRPARSNNAALGVGGNVPPFDQLPSGQRPPSGSWDAPRVEAAMLALTRSISVQNFNRGQGQDELSVYGAMGQRFRGPVGVGTPGTSGFRGYLKDYEYDWRLRYLSPPHFIEPEQSPWGRRRWSELNRVPLCADGEPLGTDDCVPDPGV